MTTEIDITPKTHAIVSIRRQDMPAWLAVCELVDNSFDANANNVAIEWDAASKVLSVIDNGIGAPDPAAIVTIGDHDPEDRNPSGRYGIGAKDAILAIGTAAEVTVVRNGVRRVVIADFEEICQSGRWIARGEERMARRGEAVGTTVRIMGVDKRVPVANIVENISKVFAPALRRGSTISIGGVPVRPPLEIAVEDRHQGAGVFRGKHYEWFAGVKQEGDKTPGGWRFQFKHRMLEDASFRAFGLGSKDFYKFYGVIHLIEPDDAEPSEKWVLNKHKTSAEELEELCEHIYPQIEALLERCEVEHSLTLESEIADDVGQSLTDALGAVPTRRERRQQADEPQQGTVLPANTGKRRRRATRSDGVPGSVIGGDGKRYRIFFQDTEKMGEVTGNRTANSVIFGKLHPYWQQHWNNRDVVKCAAMFMLGSQGVMADGDQPIMAAVADAYSGTEKFWQTVGNIAAQVASREEVTT